VDWVRVRGVRLLRVLAEWRRAVDLVRTAPHVLVDGGGIAGGRVGGER
jgi:hypothetical protein